jgi:hypothetical protein
MQITDSLKYGLILGVMYTFVSGSLLLINCYSYTQLQQNYRSSHFQDLNNVRLRSSIHSKYSKQSLSTPYSLISKIPVIYVNLHCQCRSHHSKCKLKLTIWKLTLNLIKNKSTPLAIIIIAKFILKSLFWKVYFG